jgi:hypothetical protein
MPIRTSAVAPRSSIDRGRSAESTPSGKAISSQKIAPPIVSASVTGSARLTISLTGSLDT